MVTSEMHSKAEKISQTPNKITGVLRIRGGFKHHWSPRAPPPCDSNEVNHVNTGYKILFIKAYSKNRKLLTPSCRIEIRIVKGDKRMRKLTTRGFQLISMLSKRGRATAARRAGSSKRSAHSRRIRVSQEEQASGLDPHSPLFRAHSNWPMRSRAAVNSSTSNAAFSTTCLCK